MSPVELCWNITSYVSIVVQFVAAGICLGIFVSPYVPSRSKAVKAGAVYSVAVTVLYIMPPRIDNILAFFIGTLAAFAVMCAEDRRNISQKIFLSVTFFSLRWLSASMVGIMDRFFDIVLFNPGLAARVWLHYGLYVAVRVLDMLFGFLLLLLSVKAANRAYESKGRYMERRELVMLSVPSLSGIRHGSPCDNDYFPEMEDITGGAVRS